MSRILVHTDKFFPLLEPTVDDIDIEDIAHSLSHQCRFNGHTPVFYSVAQHCVIVAKSLPPPLRLRGLLHDGSETYYSDIPTPLKNLMPEYRAMEDRCHRVIERKFGLPEGAFDCPEVKLSDLRALVTEFRDIRGVTMDREGFERLQGIEPFKAKIRPIMKPETAKRQFLKMFHELRKV
jgi:uncharacterized protein